MLRCSSRHLILAKLGRTKLGAEVLTQTRVEMREIEHSDNRFIRFLTRRRPIDYLALQVDGPITKELHPSFRYVKYFCTFLLTAPVFVLLITGVLSPSYYVLVPSGFVNADQFARMWEFSHWSVVLAGQIFIFLIFYDLSVYVRYPFFAHVLAPIYRRFGWLSVQRQQQQQRGASLTVEELRRLRRGAPVKPLGVPLSEMRRTAQQQQQQQQRPDPFGNRRKSK
ncbi:uncharacterized protein TM35_000091260 [Trypanosoma theileri]|uniref:Uncharacterized protein n=1 Tax=Trypanosoma theileri TaxID=67003 RepID=A0A1X0NZD9_9TRYP|nr:uncharacterized protein TM35_000091260 [Trypanosoma theileri]ORC90076.1 hypothetical protein TM35_000091260 [Trypanosoma theileri]